MLENQGLQACRSPTIHFEPPLSAPNKFVAFMSTPDNTWFMEDDPYFEKYHSTEDFALEVGNVSTNESLESDKPKECPNDAGEVIVFGIAAAESNVDALGN